MADITAKAALLKERGRRIRLQRGLAERPPIDRQRMLAEAEALRKENDALEEALKRRANIRVE